MQVGEFAIPKRRPLEVEVVKREFFKPNAVKFRMTQIRPFRFAELLPVCLKQLVRVAHIGQCLQPPDKQLLRDSFLILGWNRRWHARSTRKIYGD